MRPAVRKAAREAARKMAEVYWRAFLAGLAASAFMTPVAAVALVVRWLW